MEREPVTDVVVLLPGILGSALSKNGVEVWSSSRRSLLGNVVRAGRPLQDLALVDDRPDEPETDDGVTATRLIPDTHMVPGLWTIDGYSKLARRIGELPGVVPGDNFFELPYDWRRDNRVAARKLDACSREWLARRRERHPDARLVLVAHSMGGLVGRYFTECLGGWERTRALVTIGTPFRGSLNALDFLVNGMRKRIGPVTLIDLSAVVASLTSVYQLLPTYRCWRAPDRDFVDLAGAGPIDGLVPERLDAARAFHDEIGAAVARNARRDEYRESGHTIQPIAGMWQPTLQSAEPAADHVRVHKHYGDRDRDGDGRVMREVACPVDGADNVSAWHVVQQHASLQNDDAVIAQVQAILTAPRDALRDIPVRAEFGLDLDDAYAAGEEIHVPVRMHEDAPPLEARVVDTETGEEVDRVAVADRNGVGPEAELRPLAAGTYRLIVDAAGVAPVVGVFAVLPRA